MCNFDHFINFVYYSVFPSFLFVIFLSWVILRKKNPLFFNIFFKKCIKKADFPILFLCFFLVFIIFFVTNQLSLPILCKKDFSHITGSAIL